MNQNIKGGVFLRQGNRGAAGDFCPEKEFPPSGERGNVADIQGGGEFSYLKFLTCVSFVGEARV